MAIELTEWATDILNRAQAAAARFNPNVTIRLSRTPAGVEALLAEEPEADDRPIAAGAMTLYVEAGLEGLIDCKEPHDQLVLRPLDATPNSHGDHG